MAPQLTPLQKRTAQAIVNVFETGTVHGNYAAVSTTSGDLGVLSYGRSQATLASGNLALLLHDYVEADGRDARAIRSWLDRVDMRDPLLARDRVFRITLKDAADDPVMRATQDAFFDEEFWRPALRDATRLGLTRALSMAVVYDSRVHGAFALMRRRTMAEFGSPVVLGEGAWIGAYVETRRRWLANHRNKLLRNTVYRMDAFRDLIASDAWNLALPVRVRGIAIDHDALATP